MASIKKSSIKKNGDPIAGLEKQLAALHDKLRKALAQELVDASKAAKKAAAELKLARSKHQLLAKALLKKPSAALTKQLGKAEQVVALAVKAEAAATKALHALQADSPIAPAGAKVAKAKATAKSAPAKTAPTKVTAAKPVAATKAPSKAVAPAAAVNVPKAKPKPKVVSSPAELKSAPAAPVAAQDKPVAPKPIAAKPAAPKPAPIAKAPEAKPVPTAAVVPVVAPVVAPAAVPAPTPVKLEATPVAPKAAAPIKVAPPAAVQPKPEPPKPEQPKTEQPRPAPLKPEPPAVSVTAPTTPASAQTPPAAPKAASVKPPPAKPAAHHGSSLEADSTGDGPGRMRSLFDPIDD